MSNIATKLGFEEIGVIGVDSGMFGILRHNDLHHWTAQETGDPIGIAVWGRDKDVVVKRILELGFTVTKPSFYLVTLNRKADFELVTNTIEQVRSAGNMFDNSYDRVRLEETHFSSIDPKGKHKMFWSSTEHGDGGYGVYSNGDMVVVGELPDGSKYDSWSQGEPFDLTEETTFVAIDPCYLDEGLFGGTLFNLQPGHYVYILIRNCKTKKPAGIGIRKA